MRGQGSRLSLLLRQRVRKNGTKLLPMKSAVSSERAWYLVVCLLQRFLNEAQDETRAVITQQAVRKKKPTHTF